MSEQYEPVFRHPMTGRIWPDKPEHLWTWNDFHPNAPALSDFGLDSEPDWEEEVYRDAWDAYERAEGAYWETDECSIRQEQYWSHVCKQMADFYAHEEARVVGLTDEKFMRELKSRIDRAQRRAKKVGERGGVVSDDWSDDDILRGLESDALVHEVWDVTKFIAARGAGSARLRRSLLKRLGTVRLHAGRSSELDDAIDAAILAGSPVDTDAELSLFL